MCCTAEAPVLVGAPAEERMLNTMAARGWRALTSPAVFVAAVAALLGYRFFHFIALYAVNIPYWDQWDFLSDFFPGGRPTLLRLFLHQHGPHREGVGLIADKLLYAATAWNIRAESFMIGACIFAAMLLALALKRKLAGRLRWTDAAIPLIFLTLVQWETLIGTPNPAYSAIPLLLILLYSLALLEKAWPARYGMVLVLNFLLLFTGFGIFMSVVTAGVFLLEIYWRARGWSSVPAGGSITALLGACGSAAVFLIGYHFAPAADCFTIPHAPWAPYAEFASILFANFAGLWILGVRAPNIPLPLMHLAGIVPILAAGAAFLLLASALVRKKTPEALRRKCMVPAVLLAFSGLFAVDTAAGRTCLGLSSAFNSRYTTLLIPAFLGIFLTLEAWLARELRPASAMIRRTALILFAVLILPGGVITPPAFHYSSVGKRAWASCYLQRASIAECDRLTHFQIYPQPERTHLESKLAYLRERRLSFFSRSGE